MPGPSDKRISQSITCHGCSHSVKHLYASVLCSEQTAVGKCIPLGRKKREVSSRWEQRKAGHREEGLGRALWFMTVFLIHWPGQGDVGVACVYKPNKVASMAVL